MKRFFIFIVLCLSCLSSLVAQAVTPSSQAYDQRQGVYASALIGYATAYSKYDPYVYSFGTKWPYDTRNTGLGLEGAVGYLFNPNWGIEAGVGDSDTEGDHFFVGGQEVYVGGQEVNVYHLALKARWLLTPRFDLYGKLGGAYVENYNYTGVFGTAEASSYAIAPYIGAGAEFFITHHIALQAGFSGAYPYLHRGIRASQLFGLGIAVYF